MTCYYFFIISQNKRCVFFLSFFLLLSHDDHRLGNNNISRKRSHKSFIKLEMQSVNEHKSFYGDSASGLNPWCIKFDQTCNSLH